MAEHPRPSKDDLARAAARRHPVRDVTGPRLDVLFVGINPGLYSGATGHHFARPGNRFWPALHASGFTPRRLHPSEARELLALRLGLSKLVHRPSATAEELTREELRRGGARVRRLVRRLRPRVVCFLGVGAYERAYGLARVSVGLQAGRFAGSALWVLPNPSGLNASYQLPDFVRMFRALRASLDGLRPPGGGRSAGRRGRRRRPARTARPRRSRARPASARRRA